MPGQPTDVSELEEPARVPAPAPPASPRSAVVRTIRRPSVGFSLAGWLEALLGRRLLLAVLLAAGISLAVSLAVKMDRGFGLLVAVAGSESRALAADVTGTAPTIDMRTATPAQAYAYLRNEFGVGDGLLKNRHMTPFIPLWGNVLALNAFATLSLLPGRISRPSRQAYRRAMLGLSYYWHPARGALPSGYLPHLPLFFTEPERGLWDDDNAWAGLALMHGYRLTGNRVSLLHCEEIFRLITGQWDPHGGGIYWQAHLTRTASPQRSAVSNAPVVRLGTQLFQATGRRSYLRWSERIFAWTNRALLDPRTGLYDDHVGGNHRRGQIKRTYVQGAELGAMEALHRVAPGRYPLTHAVRFAERSLNYFRFCSQGGNAAFEAVYFRNLMGLIHLDPEPHLVASVDRALRNAVRRLPREPQLLRNAAGATQLLALAALPQKRYGKLF